MSHTTPDTNILIFEVVGGNQDQQEQAETYFKLLNRDVTTGVLLKEVEYEFHKVIKKRISELREFALKAEKHRSWEKAQDYIPENRYAENFAEALMEGREPDNANSELSDWKSRIENSYRRRKRKFKEDSERSLDPEKTSQIEQKIPEKREGEDNTADARIVQSSFLHSHEFSRNLTIISDDSNMLDADYTLMEEEMEFTEYRNEVTASTAEKYSETV